MYLGFLKHSHVLTHCARLPLALLATGLFSVSAFAQSSATPLDNDAFVTPPVAKVTASRAPSKRLIDDDVLSYVRNVLANDIVNLSVANQNKLYADMQQSDIDAIDQKWRKETEQNSQPLIAATLSNPLSSYLTRIQAHSGGLFTEIFVMDDKGLNVGQSNISSDYWQGDEDKWQKTYLVGPNAVFIDEPELHEETQTWRVQANLAIADDATNQTIGAATFEINLTELERRN